MSHLPSHYKAVRIDDKIHHVPAHIVADIHKSVEPYAEFVQATVSPDAEDVVGPEPEAETTKGKGKKK